MGAMLLFQIRHNRATDENNIMTSSSVWNHGVNEELTGKYFWTSGKLRKPMRIQAQSVSSDTTTMNGTK